MKREPRLERLAAASRGLRPHLKDLDDDQLGRLQELLERVLEQEVLDRDALRELEQRLLP